MWTSEMLDSVEEFVIGQDVDFKDVKRPWCTAAYSTKEVPQDLKDLGVVAYALKEDFRKRSKYTRSKWVVVEGKNDTLRIVPELLLRALSLKGAPLRPTDMPFWKEDGSVQIATASESFPGRPIGSKYGVPAHSKEYKRVWRAEHKELLRAASSRYQKKLREKAKMFDDKGERVTKKSVDELSIIEQFAARMGTTVEQMTEEKAKEDGQALEGAVENEYAECPRCSSALPVDSSVGGGSGAIVPKKCEWCGWPEGV